MAGSQTATTVEDPFGWVGQTLDGRYRMDRVVGQGGFGVVYRAVHLTWGVPVAVKCLKVGPSARGPLRERFLKSFHDEGKLLHLLRDTPGIVRALDTGASESPSGLWSPYLVLEWLEGRTLAADLADRLSRGAGGRPLTQALDLLEPAASALVVAHAAGIFHRDLKPENLFLAIAGGRCTLKVLDFGVAKFVGDAEPYVAAAAVTGVAPRAFSRAYGAPEQFEPELLGNTGPWTDVYQLALILLEVVSGRQPYGGHSIEELRSEAVDPERRPSFSNLGVVAPERVVSAMRHALDLDPRNRPTAQAFWSELRAASQGHAPASALRRGETEPSSTPAPPASPGRSPPEPQPRAATTSPVTMAELWAAPPRPSDPRHGRGPRRWSTARTAALLGVPLLALLGTALAVVGARTSHAQDNMILIPEGRYIVGSPSGDAHRCEPAQHPVYLLPFFMDRTEVTVAEYLRCQSAGKCSSTKPHAKEQESWKGLELCNELRAERGERVENHPMNCVDRNQAAAYCEFVEKRLPTDDEWEAAARGPRGSEYPWGDSAPTCEKAVFGRPAAGCPGHEGTAPVASTPASALGLFDLAGNVWEWTETTCSAPPTPTVTGRQSVPAAPVRAPPAPKDHQEAEIERNEAELGRLLAKLGKDTGVGSLRGGGFEWNADNLRAWKHLPLAWPLTKGGVSTGFRCAADAP